MITQEEAESLRSKVSNIELLVTQCVEASKESALASKEVAQQINGLVIEMRQRDVKDEYRDKQADILTDRFDRMNNRFEDYVKAESEVLKRVKRSHDRFDKFVDGMTSNNGRILSIVIIAFIAWALGLDLETIGIK